MSSTTDRPSGTLLGIDIGGTGIKGAPVDLVWGVLAADRRRLATPHPATPAAVADVVAQIVDPFPTTGPIGVTFPAIVRRGRVESAANVDPAWIGTDAVELLGQRLGRPVVVLNDADAAGLAEMAFGAGRGRTGVVVMVTFGTGIGTALFLDGRLVPNTELGHIIVSGNDGEKIAAASVKEREDLSWKKWSKRVDAYLARLESLVSPDTIIVGGGVSKDHAHFLPRLHARAEVVPAELFNDAGIVGAALAAAALMPPAAAPRNGGERTAPGVALAATIAATGR
jgi:polyphosphate glucokinase